MENNHHLSEDLRLIEQQIDTEYLKNPLLLQPFDEAVWSFLAYCEHINIETFVLDTPEAEQSQRAFADNLVNVAKNPLQWLFLRCPRGGHRPNLERKSLIAAKQLFHLANEYQQFETVYTYASLGLLFLSIDGNRISTSGPMRNDGQYDAYDRLVSHYMDRPNKPNITAAEFVNQICRNVSTTEGFGYRLNPKIVKDGIKHFGLLEQTVSLIPIETQLNRYTVAQFLQVSAVIVTIALIHFHARLHATRLGINSISHSLVTMEHKEFHARVCRYSNVPPVQVSAIIEDLTFGSRGQTRPDIALQPLIPLANSMLGLSPSILMHCSLERNLHVLLNRIPEERATYSKVNKHREISSRSRIREQLTGLSLEFWNGQVPSWKECSDIDLVIISHEEKCCLILELKSFIGPAEPREIWNRSNDIEHGIQQINSRKQKLTTNEQDLFSVTSIDKHYHISWAVASETSIGISSIQSDSVPVVNIGHLMAKIISDRSLRKCCEWLDRNGHLPIEGIHYNVVETETRVGNWILEWYGIECLVENYL